MDLQVSCETVWLLFRVLVEMQMGNVSLKTAQTKQNKLQL